MTLPKQARQTAVKPEQREIEQRPLEIKSWLKQKPRMSSARIMIEVRRRLWLQVCQPDTDFHTTEKLLARIKALSKRIDARVQAPERLTSEQIQMLDDLFNNTIEEKKKYRGLASLSPEKRKQIASKGGAAVSKNRAHMAEIGRRGGLSRSKKVETK